MKAYFNDKGILIVESENNTEMVALKSFCSTFSGDSPSWPSSNFIIEHEAHLKTTTIAAAGHSERPFIQARD